MRGLVVALAIVSMASLAEAQAEREAAREDYAEGERQFAAGNYQLALESFESSYRRMEGDRRAQVLIMHDIGLCRQRLGRNADALEAFEVYLNEAPADEDPQRLAQARESARDLRARVAAGDIGPRAGGGGPSPLVITGAAILALGGVALIAAIPTGVLASDGEARLAELCTNGACGASERGLLDETRTLALATDALWIAGAAIAAIGVVLLSIGVVTESSAPSASVICTEEGCVGTLRARF
jgi:tetratricopeptide (TPR) repeat protein